VTLIGTVIVVLVVVPVTTTTRLHVVFFAGAIKVGVVAVVLVSEHVPVTDHLRVPAGIPVTRTAVEVRVDFLTDFADLVVLTAMRGIVRSFFALSEVNTSPYSLSSYVAIGHEIGSEVAVTVTE
jgi:hypothetical protein